jgi:hypothetical protein
MKITTRIWTTAMAAGFLLVVMMAVLDALLAAYPEQHTGYLIPVIVLAFLSISILGMLTLPLFMLVFNLVEYIQPIAPGARRLMLLAGMLFSIFTGIEACVNCIVLGLSFKEPEFQSVVWSCFYPRINPHQIIAVLCTPVVTCCYSLVHHRKMITRHFDLLPPATATKLF